MKTKGIPSIVVGMLPYELKRPYHPSISCENIRDVHRYIKDRGSFTFGTAGQAESTIDHISKSGAKTIEIYGAWLQLCVAGATAHSLTKGLDVVIPKKYTFVDPSPDAKCQLNDAVTLYLGDTSYQFLENYDIYSFVR